MTFLAVIIGVGRSVDQALVLSADRMAELYRQGKTTVERTCGLFLILLGGRQGLCDLN